MWNIEKLGRAAARGTRPHSLTSLIVVEAVKVLKSQPQTKLQGEGEDSELVVIKIYTCTLCCTFYKATVIDINAQVKQLNGY